MKKTALSFGIALSLSAPLLFSSEGRKEIYNKGNGPSSADQRQEWLSGSTRASFISGLSTGLALWSIGPHKEAALCGFALGGAANVMVTRGNFQTVDFISQACGTVVGATTAFLIYNGFYGSRLSD